MGATADRCALIVDYSARPVLEINRVHPIFCQSEGRSFILFAWLPVTLPGLVIVTTAIALSLVGDGVSELLRPTR